MVKNTFLIVVSILDTFSSSDILFTICVSTLFGDLTSIFTWPQKVSYGKAEQKSIK